MPISLRLSFGMLLLLMLGALGHMALEFVPAQLITLVWCGLTVWLLTRRRPTTPAFVRGLGALGAIVFGLGVFAMIVMSAWVPGSTRLLTVKWVRLLAELAMGVWLFVMASSRSVRQWYSAPE